MEIDMAAGHCMILPATFDKVVSQSCDPPVLDSGQITMHLADGTSSNAVVGCTRITIARADKPDIAEEFPVIVCQGPHALLGRPALQALWPEYYDSWSTSAKTSINSMHSSTALRCTVSGNTRASTAAMPDDPTTVITDSPQTGTAVAQLSRTTESIPSPRSLPAPPTGNILRKL